MDYVVIIILYYCIILMVIALGRRQTHRISVFSDKGDTVILGCALCLHPSDKDVSVKWWKLSRAQTSSANNHKDFHTQYVSALVLVILRFVAVVQSICGEYSKN